MSIARQLPILPRRALGLLAALAVAGFVAFAVHALIGGGPEGRGNETRILVYDAVMILAGLIILLRAAAVPGERAAWATIAAGILLWAAGFVAYSTYVVDLDPVPVLSLADMLWLPRYPVFFLGLVLLLRSRRPRLRRGVWLDAAIAVLAVGSLTFAVLFEPIVASTGGSTAAVLTNLGYPLGDLLVLSCVLGVFARSGWRPGRLWAIVCSAFLVGAAADTLYLYLASIGAYQQGTALDLPWLVMMLVLAWVAWQPADAPRPDAERSWREVVVPTGFAALALGVTTLASVEGVGLPGLIMATAAIALAFVRTATALAAVRSAGETKKLLERTASILDAAGEGIVGVNLEGRVTFVNAAAARLTGHQPAGLVGRSLHAAVHHSHEDGTPYPAADCPIRASLSYGSSCTVGDEVFWRADATSFPVEYTTTPLREDGDAAGAVVVFRDVTEQRRVDRMKDEFTSVVSHELRTPLTSIRGSLGLLAGGALGPLPEKAQRMADIAVHNSDRLVRLINDILDVERMESGKVTMERRSCDLADLVAQAAEVMQGMAAEAEVELCFDPAHATLWADPDRIVQTLTNLLSNAVKFSEPGGRVRLWTEHRDAEVMVRVRDEGRGIPQDRLEKVFERFEQIDASDAREKGGSGLGLAICRSIVEAHGGRIWAQSALGEGSTLCFTLPALPTGAPALPERSGDERPAVLVCDDDEAVLEVVGAMLNQHGYRPVLASCGEEALTRAADERPRAIVLDLLMPGMSGWETAAALGERPETRDIPIVILSVLSPQETETPAGEVVDWVEKPLEADSLFAALDRALEARPASASCVLVVEDDDDLASVLCAMFEHRGLRTARAATTREAIELSRRLEPDLLVLDLLLPDGDGYEVVRALREHDTLRHAPTVIYTACDIDEAQRERLRLGETRFVTKGAISPQNFEQRVIDLLEPITREREYADDAV